MEHAEEIQRGYRQWRAENLDELRVKRQLRDYGLSPGEYQVLLKRAKGRCEICKNPFRNPKDRQTDHCHKTGKVRGLLCSKCNRGLGYLNDSPETLRRALSYLLDKPTALGELV